MDSQIETNSMICVYICGQVQKPDVYQTPQGTRLYELIDLAGGFTQDAYSGYLNLADRVEDGQKIVVPSVSDVESGNVPAGNDETETSDGLIDINTASEEMLMTLPGVGQAKASDIITYRNKNGNFSKTEDIMKVSGIKENLYNKIKDFIKV